MLACLSVPKTLSGRSDVGVGSVDFGRSFQLPTRPIADYRGTRLKADVARRAEVLLAVAPCLPRPLAWMPGLTTRSADATSPTSGWENDLAKSLRACRRGLALVCPWRARTGRGRSDPVPGGPYRIRAVDATTVQEPGSTGTHWRVHYVNDLANLQCDHFKLTDVHDGETFKRIPVGAGDLMLGDRAYGTSQGIAYVASQGADVLIRIALHMVPLYRESGDEISLLRHVRGLKVGMVREGASWVHCDWRRVAGRWIAIKRSRQAAELVCLRMGRTARRKGRKL